MPRFFHLTRKRKISRKKRNSAGILSNKSKSINTVIYISLFLLFFAYLVQINSLATKGYAISELEDTLIGIEKQNSVLHTEVLSLQATDNIKEKLSEIEMVATGQVEYLTIKPPIVAYR